MAVTDQQFADLIKILKGTGGAPVTGAPAIPPAMQVPAPSTPPTPKNTPVIPSQAPSIMPTSTVAGRAVYSSQDARDQFDKNTTALNESAAGMQLRDQQMKIAQEKAAAEKAAIAKAASTPEQYHLDQFGNYVKGAGPAVPKVDPIQKQIEDANNQIDTDYNDRVAMLDAQFANINAAAQSQIESIKRTYAKRRDEMQQFNKNVLGTQTQLGIRSGRQRYAAEVETGIISDVEKQGMDRIADIDAEERTLISQAEQAKNDKQFALLSAKMDMASAAREEKNKAISDLYARVNDEEKNRIELMKTKSQLQKDLFEQDKSLSEGIAYGVLDAIDGIEDPDMIESIIEAYAVDEGVENPALLKSQVMKLREAQAKEAKSSLPQSVREWRASIEQGLIPANTKLIDFQKMTDPMLGLNIAEKNQNMAKSQKEIEKLNAEIKDMGPGGQKAIKDSIDLQFKLGDQYAQNPVIQQNRVMQSSYGRILSLAPKRDDATYSSISTNGSALRAIASNYLRMTMPDVARQADLGNTLANDSLSGQTEVLVGKWLDDQNVAKTEIREMLGAADTLYKSSVSELNKANKEFSSTIRGSGYEGEILVPGYKEPVVEGPKQLPQAPKAPIVVNAPPGTALFISQVKASGFDYDGAKKAGATDKEIAEYLKK